MISNCHHCGSEFDKTKGRSNCCSESCRFWIKVDVGTPNQCWNWKAGLVKDGYGMFVRDSVSGSGKSITASRMAWILTYGEIEYSILVLHRCDNPKCCNPNHEFLGTDMDNSKDKDSKGRANHTRGTENGNTKLTIESVKQIKSLKRIGMGNQEIASRFDISDGHVANIMAGRSWNYVD